MPSETLTCQELVEFVKDYLEGALQPTERARFEAHIGQCRHCAIYLDQMRATIRLIGKLTRAAPSLAVKNGGSSNT